MHSSEAEDARGAGQLVSDLLRFQVKLLVDAARDLILVPLTLGAAVLDLLLSHRRKPRYFYALLALGERSERLIDLWAVLYERMGPAPGNVDQVMDQIESAIRDPQQGKRRARVLRRWLERRIRREAAQRLGPRHGGAAPAAPPQEDSGQSDAAEQATPRPAPDAGRD
ncbi:hypothetical protein [Pseudomarimonas salicorniae]|uniref:Uncharacterized protein n=1 Tax=Pseudomarimonas salicorniae TaxID=2933270 RepID=A0ABT0GGK5_9GAMM|nr:hypothetical protein [Lysobacter sp. CAU 1642]MCK7593660.1 hypothetical protein [Lysobacter sp. CAU 1642]